MEIPVPMVRKVFDYRIVIVIQPVLEIRKLQVIDVNQDNIRPIAPDHIFCTCQHIQFHAFDINL